MDLPQGKGIQWLNQRAFSVENHVLLTYLHLSSIQISEKVLRKEQHMDIDYGLHWSDMFSVERCK